MPRKARELTALEVRRLVQPGLHFVGGVAGLALQVTGSGARSWILRAVVGASRRDIGLGGFPDVPLQDARESARRTREQIVAGVDPVEQRRLAKQRLIADQARAMDFEACCRMYIEAHAAGWKNAKHAQQWGNTLSAYAYPVIGRMRVEEIELPHILKVLEPIWRSKTETASRLRGRIEQVLSWATVRGYRTGLNPARWRGHLDAVLPAPTKVSRTESFSAVAVNDAPAAYARIRAVDGMGAQALLFCILTATRSGEVRGARWSDFDLNAAVWTIPAERMKAGREHRVPLSNMAVELLRAIPRLADSDLVFFSPRGKQLSDATLGAVLKRLEIDATVHGFRSTFRDWASERTSHSHEVAEMALAHTIKNKAEAAYRRGDLLEKRAVLMEDWAAYLSSAQG
jgi:integrase